MKRVLIFIVLLAGLIAAACSSPPDKKVTSARHSDLTAVSTVLTVSTVDAPVMYAQEVTALPVPDNPAEKKSNFFLANWAELVLGLFGFLKILVNLTPTTKDNAVFGLLDNFINMIIPNLKKGGGKFT